MRNLSSIIPASALALSLMGNPALAEDKNTNMSDEISYSISEIKNNVACIEIGQIQELLTCKIKMGAGPEELEKTIKSWIKSEYPDSSLNDINEDARINAINFLVNHFLYGVGKPIEKEQSLMSLRILSK